MAQQTTDRLLAGRYRLLERLGTGGMASVWLAEDERLGRQVALKRLHGDGPEDMARRFEREAKVLASLNHQNVVAVFDTVPDDEGIVIVMEHVPGETLRDALKRGPLPPGEAAAVVEGIGAALDHGHRQGVVHRDVKPANVLLRPDGVVKLADFGIAIAAERTHITRTGTVMGTAAYMAPEQLEGRDATPATDVYALGAVAFEVLSGRRAVGGKTPAEIVHRVATRPPPDLRESWKAAPPAAVAVVRRAMARDPRDRPSSAGDLAAELREALGEGSGGHTAATAPVAGTASAVIPGATGPSTGATALIGAAVPAPPTGATRHEPSLAARKGHLRWIPLLLLVGALTLALALAAGDDDERASEPATAGKADRRAQEPASPPRGADPAEPASDPLADGLRLQTQGYDALQQGRYDEAIDASRRSAGLLEGTGRIEYAYALFNLGRSLRLAGRPAEAIPVLEQRLEIPNQTDAVKAELKLAEQALGGGKSSGKREKGHEKDD